MFLLRKIGYNKQEKRSLQSLGVVPFPRIANEGAPLKSRAVPPVYKA